jgi:hypothetical protein
VTGPERGVVSVRTELWFAWAELAGEHELAAAEWRTKAKADIGAGRNPSDNMGQETKASIASVAAAGAALETIGRNLRFFAEDPNPPPRGAALRLLSQVRHVYPNAEIGPELADRIKEAFARRNETLHYSSRPEPVGPHPLGMTTTWVARTFTIEAARKSVDTVADFVTAAFNPGLSEVKSAESWAHYCRHVGKRLRGRSTIPIDIVP